MKLRARNAASSNGARAEGILIMDVWSLVTAQYINSKFEVVVLSVELSTG